MKKIFKNEEVKYAIKAGTDAVANAVKVTLGPGGKNVLYNDQYGRSVITKDGIAVAEQINHLECPAQTLVANTFRQACKKTAQIAGDGTTSTAVLAQSFIHEGLNSKLHSKDLISALNRLCVSVVDKLNKTALPCNDLDSVRNVALISSNGDEEIANLLTEAIDKVGNDGIVTIDDSTSGNNSIHFSSGFQLNSGFLSNYFASDENKSKAILDKCLMLVTDSNIENTTSILAALSISAESGQPLFILAPKISQEVVDALVVNHLKGTIKVCAVKMPPCNDIHETMQDICSLTGATLISDRLERKLSDFKPEWFGKAEQVTIQRDYTIIRNNRNVQQRVAEIQAQFANSESEYQTDKLKERIAKLAGCIAVIKIGGITDVERIEKKARVEDALQATKAAIKEGTVLGGGYALSDIADELSPEHMFAECLWDPINQIEDNLNIDTSLDRNADIIDPVIVTKQVVINAVSIAISLLSTEIIIVDIKDGV